MVLSLTGWDFALHPMSILRPPQGALLTTTIHIDCMMVPPLKSVPICSQVSFYATSLHHLSKHAVDSATLLYLHQLVCYFST